MTLSVRPALLQLLGRVIRTDAACAIGSGTHTVGLPLRIGKPSAPGNVPK